MQSLDNLFEGANLGIVLVEKNVSREWIAGLRVDELMSLFFVFLEDGSYEKVVENFDRHGAGVFGSGDPS
jgi:hypothetical protein